KDFQTALGNLRGVFTAIRHANLRLHPRKCHLLRRETAFLGHVISERGVATDPAKVTAVKEWPEPANIRQLRSFLGLASYYRRFVQDFATIASPLHRLTQKGQAFVWDSDCERAFATLRAALTSAPVLGFPDPKETFVLDTDASDVELGAVLSQVGGHVIGYFSRSLSRAERNYCVTRRELLAVVAALKHFRPYLYGQRFQLRTDHTSLTWLLSFKEPEGQLARWLEVLQTFDFEARHRAGRLHGNADALSRRPCSEGECRFCERIEARGNAKAQLAAVCAARPQVLQEVDEQQVRVEQSRDSTLCQVAEWLRSGHRPQWAEVSDGDRELKALVSQWGSLVERD
uniref:Reverse transcriptase RNase H-like domain-containing protein n=1 Tax=Paramormyrops kingsleyae TaxID=1676925 RepID=A0A3B3RSX8_9TELE